MPPIVLTTINARYYHTSFGLRRLAAALGPLREQCVIREFQVGQDAARIVEALLAESPRVIGLGVYIWNAVLAAEVVRMIKALRPEIMVVIGGPEVSHGGWSLGPEAACDLHADYLIRGEGELAFAELARQLLNGECPAQKIIDAAPPDLGALPQPYELYSDDDLRRRKLFVEASRGCPYRCEFCLSSLDDAVRDFPLAPFLESMERLIERGGREFIFVDRTFNLNAARAAAILDFFLARWCDGMHLHFEIVPDRLPEPLLQAFTRFPAGGLHLEAGLQTFNPQVQEAISRRQDMERTLANLQFLRAAGAWIHADLIIGLPGESWESFGAGFDRLLELRPQQIQVGVLKRLKGAPIARHDAPHAMIYSAQPPYEILQNGAVDFLAMQRLKRFARYFELYYNSGNFPESLELLWSQGRSPFNAFMALSDFIWERSGRTHELALGTLAGLLHEFLARDGRGEENGSGQIAAEVIERDFRRVPGRKDKLLFKI